jgi:Rap1a immunity proteins
MTQPKHLCKIVALLAALTLTASMATANDAYLKGNFTGEEMLKYCKVANDDSVRDFERGVCTGFIDGFAAGHHAAELWHAFHHRDEDIDNIYGHLCVPKDANRTAMVTLFVRYLEKNSDKLKWSAGLLLESALREGYPCEKEN